ncbi:MAG: S8 family serine peptidase [Chloroflexaceae bacterium]|nr:S8 family serine peptidase [Chloroflexaceae bacterium]
MLEDVVSSLETEASRTSAKFSIDNYDLPQSISATNAQGIQAAYAPKELLIKPSSAIAAADLAALREQLGGQLVESLGSLGFELWSFDSLSADQAYELLREDARFELVERNYVIEQAALAFNDPIEPAAIIPNDPNFNQQFGLNSIDAPQAWQIATARPSNVAIAVIDSGIDYNHPDLAANIFRNLGEIAGDGLDNDGNGFVDDIRGYDFVANDSDPFDQNRHGTHVAGILGAAANNSIGIAGVASGIPIIPIRVLDANGNGTFSNLVRGINYAVDLARRQDIKLVINLSLGGSTTSFPTDLFNAVSVAAGEDVLFVAAAGNSAVNTDTTPHFPSSLDLPNVIAVAATDANDNLSGFSNFGVRSVDLGAPGVNIRSTLSNGQYGELSGTSQATPFVSGVAALLWATENNLTPTQIRDRSWIGLIWPHLFRAGRRLGDASTPLRYWRQKRRSPMGASRTATLTSGAPSGRSASRPAPSALPLAKALGKSISATMAMIFLPMRAESAIPRLKASSDWLRVNWTRSPGAMPLKARRSPGQFPWQQETPSALTGISSLTTTVMTLLLSRCA